MAITITTMESVRFNPGRTTITMSALMALLEADQHPGDFLVSHINKNPFQLCSVYQTSLGKEFRIVTESDWSATTIQMTEEDSNPVAESQAAKTKGRLWQLTK